MESSDVQLAADILHLLKYSKNSQSCIDGLNQFLSAVKAGRGPGVLHELVTSSSRLEELLAVWDAQIKVHAAPLVLFYIS